jgi:exodeoxyribonuclease VIII
MNNIMLDLETLATTSDAVVVSIGAVAFDPTTGVLGERFYVELQDLEYQQSLGRKISANTVRWWLDQGPIVQRALADTPMEHVDRVDMRTALERFARYIERNGDREALIWGNGADFDNMILGSLYQSAGYKAPWSYGRNRCYRTLKALGIARGVIPPNRAGVHHNALDDAVHQTEHLTTILACLGPR